MGNLVAMHRHPNSAGPFSSPASPTQSSPELDHGMPEKLLQLGWGKFWSRTEKRAYYFNKLTNRSQWKMPQLDPVPSDKTYPTLSNKRKMQDDPICEKTDNKYLKKLKTNTDEFDKFDIVKGSMLDVIKRKVIKCLNSRCSVGCLKQEYEHICMKILTEDITFCYIGLVQKFNIAYTSMKKEVAHIVKLKEAGDEIKCNELIALMCAAAANRGMQASEARLYCTIDMLSVLVGHGETYAQIFEQIRAMLLTLQLSSAMQTEGKSSCIRGAFGN